MRIGQVNSVNSYNNSRNNNINKANSDPSFGRVEVLTSKMPRDKFFELNDALKTMAASFKNRLLISYDGSNYLVTSRKKTKSFPDIKELLVNIRARGKRNEAKKHIQAAQKNKALKQAWFNQQDEKVGFLASGS